ncbi:hypothetical protein G6F56_011942 [Rhizopus delemar]|nr:hypothetical protein G6F56_011942 [Rhizopus delemar]
MSSQAQKRSRVDYDESEFASQNVKSQSINWDDEEIERKVKALCRYVLACEHKKTTIRRDNINKIVLPDNRRLFNTLFQRANERLRTVFGFELQEATLKDRIGPQDTQLQATQGSSTQQTQKLTSIAGTYFLRNIMKEHYILPEIVERSKEEYINTGVLYVVLALLFANEYQMNSTDLNEHLDRLKFCEIQLFEKSQDG